MSWRNQKKREVSETIKFKARHSPTRLLSSVLKISRRNLYNQNTKLVKRDLVLRDQILKVIELNPSYGHRRVAIELMVGKNRVRRVMRLFGIKPYKRKARWSKKKDWRQPQSGYPNLIKGSCPVKPNIFWVGDFTRLVWNQKIVYLATFMDLYTREVVGWSISTKHTAEFVIDALFNAIGQVGKPVVVHTDQGSEYKSKDYTGLLENLAVKVSHSAKASPWENAYQESFYDNFKTDLGFEFERFETPGEFIEAIHQTINYYNRRRIHTKLKMSPYQFKQKFLNPPV